MNRLQQGGTLLLPFWGAVQNKSLKRPLCVLYVCLQGILFCGPLEAETLMPGNVRLECKDCGQMGVVVLKDDGGRSVTAGSKPKHGVGERSAEGSSSGGKVVSMPHIQHTQNTDERRQNSKRPVWKADEYIHAFVLGLILAAIPFAGLLKWDSKK